MKEHKDKKMAKVKRSVLKQLIKECLVEILVEGISADSNIANALVEAATPRPSSTKKDTQYNTEVKRINSQRERLDKVKTSTKNDQMISTLTEDPMMADIFRDTAETTLQQQGISNNPKDSRPVARDAASQTVANNNLEDLFESAGNWAALAFNNNDK
tara:strand:- start:849 stop:1322 length:474 start_codon:yes stop_codon:yes gene_type:complete